MTTYARIDETGLIEEIVDTDELIFGSNYIELEENEEGIISTEQRWDFTTKSWQALPEPRQTLFSKHAFFDRLTMNEQMMLVAPDDITEIPTQAKPLLKLFAKRIEIADQIDLDLPIIVQGLAQLEQFGLLAPGRAAEILGLEQSDLNEKLASAKA